VGAGGDGGGSAAEKGEEVMVATHGGGGLSGFKGRRRENGGFKPAFWAKLLSKKQ
jgi:hypothetical protein